MATTLQAQSFSDLNVKERTALDRASLVDASELTLASTQGFFVNDTIYVGQPGREVCEKAVVASVNSQTGLTLVSGLKYAHARFEPVVSVFGGYIRIHRAVDVDGKVPADSAFTPLTVREIEADQQSTYYTDPSGGSGYWYKMTYFDAVGMTETDLAAAEPVRGSDFGHYASISEIRSEAGFDNALNLKDTVIDQQRRAAESEINAALSGAYTVPFKPVPEIINTLTIQLAAGLLLSSPGVGFGTRGAAMLKDARAAIKAYASRDGTIAGEDGTPLATGGSVSSYPDDCAPRAFTIGMRF